MAHAVDRRPVTAEPRLLSQAIPYGICGGQSNNEQGLFPQNLFTEFRYSCDIRLAPCCMNLEIDN